jgi:ABC-type amino acid transport substrate-binding protein
VEKALRGRLCTIAALTVLALTVACEDRDAPYADPAVGYSAEKTAPAESADVREPAAPGIAGGDARPPGRPVGRAQEDDIDRALNLTLAERARLEELRDRGGLSVAINEEQSIYEIDESGELIGVHYELVRSVARLLGVSVSLTPVQFSRFFERDGEVPPEVQTDPDFSYVPDLLREVDLYAVAMTPLEWRRTFLDFIPLYPTRLVYITRRGEPREPADSPNGSRFALVPNTTYEVWARSNLDLGRVTVVAADTGEALARLVSEGEADVAVADANLALAQLDDYPNLEMHPTDAELDMLSWAVARGDDGLAGLLTKAIERLRQTGRFDAIWTDYYGVSFMAYLDLLSADA